METAGEDRIRNQEYAKDIVLKRRDPWQIKTSERRVRSVINDTFAIYCYGSTCHSTLLGLVIGYPSFCIEDDNRIIEVLLKFGADPNVYLTIDGCCMPLVFWACDYHNDIHLKSLIRAGARVNTISSSYRRTLITHVIVRYKATWHESLTLMDMLLDSGADIGFVPDGFEDPFDQVKDAGLYFLLSNTRRGQLEPLLRQHLFDGPASIIVSYLVPPLDPSAVIPLFLSLK